MDPRRQVTPVLDTNLSWRGWTFRIALAGMLAGLLAHGAVAAEDGIGATAIARNDVARVETGKDAALASGDPVFRNETVRTGTDSDAKFVFSDETNLALGPLSRVTLDRFVYNDDKSYGRAALKLAKGAFRFTTGQSEKDAYEIRTGNATIGVRGTVLDIQSESARSVITLVEGKAVVCPRRKFDGDPRTLSSARLKANQCAELLEPGDTVVVTAGAARNGGTPFNFATAVNCSGGLCGRTSYADATSIGGASGSGPADEVLCGR